MISMFQIVEDVTLVAEWQDGNWHVHLFGKRPINDERVQAIVKWTPQEMAAVQWLMANGDESEGPTLREGFFNAVPYDDVKMGMYQIADELFDNLPPEVRCIP